MGRPDARVTAAAIVIVAKIISKSVRGKVGHKLTQEGHQAKAIAFWQRCATAYVATRFEREDPIDGWKPAEKVRPQRVVGIGRNR